MKKREDLAKITLKQKTSKSFNTKVIRRIFFLIATLFFLIFTKVISKAIDVIFVILPALFAFLILIQITVVRGKRNVVLSNLENVENALKDITQNFDSRDVSLADRLSGLKCSHEDKIKEVKLIDEELLNLLEP